jgi:SHS2 domain-containing protein
MSKIKTAGFEEVPHTADVELHVWGEDLPTLFRQAAQGMFQLLGIEEDSQEESIHRDLSLEAMDNEGLLILFLEELLYHIAEENIAYSIDQLSISPDNKLNASLSGREIAGYRRDIKAVTYHYLDIRRYQGGLEVNIVFDI